MHLCVTKEEEKSGIMLEKLSKAECHAEIRGRIYALQLVALESILEILASE